MDIVKYPDPILRRGGKTVETFDDQLRQTAQAMLESMYEYRGVGLAAPQVGLELKLLVLNPTGQSEDADEQMALVNPKVISKKKREWGEEGCLSFPGIYGEVERPVEIVVEYQDLDGQLQKLKAEGFLARVILHELDHLEGVLFVDRFSPVDKLRVKAQLLDLEREYYDRAPA